MPDHFAGRIDTEQLLAATATELQHLPVLVQRSACVANQVKAINEHIAQASLALLRMEDHPGTFEPWCRRFAAPGGEA
jgi:hypothetical protein